MTNRQNQQDIVVHTCSTNSLESGWSPSLVHLASYWETPAQQQQQIHSTWEMTPEFDYMCMKQTDTGRGSA